MKKLCLKKNIQLCKKLDITNIISIHVTGHSGGEGCLGQIKYTIDHLIGLTRLMLYDFESVEINICHWEFEKILTI